MKKTILITGASQGLGKATAKLFAKMGWKVIATMRNPQNEIELSQLPGVHILKLDITDKIQIEEVAKQAEAIAPIDVLFNNAAYGFAGPLEAATDEQLQNLINTNFLGTVLVTKAFLPYMRKRKQGTIITATSSTAYVPYPFVTVYAGTKAALETWSAGMNYEVSNYNIQMKTVVPGYMQTNFGKNGEFVTHPDYKEYFDKYFSKLITETGTLADSPDDIALVVKQAAIDGENKTQYIAGEHATSEYNWLQKDGIEAVTNTMKKRFFE